MLRFIKMAILAIILFTIVSTSSIQNRSIQSYDIAAINISSLISNKPIFTHIGGGFITRPSASKFSGINIWSLIAAGIGLIGLRLRRRN